MKQIGSILDEQNWLETMELACKRSIDANPEKEGDFMKDGFLHCGKCKEPKREYFEWHGHQILTSRDCKCIRDEKERIEKQKRYEEKMARIARLRSVSLMDEVFYKATFKNFDITDDNRKIYNACAKYCRAFQQMLEDILKWALSHVAPRCIFMENVEEIQTWGPLKEIDGNTYPDPEHKGETFNGFVAMLTTGISKSHPAFAEACEFLKITPDSEQGNRLAAGLGYVVDYRVMKACDYGAPTIRKRFYLIARRDGLPIVWPEPTHGKGLKPYRTAAECIDWSIPCPSIFGRKKDLAVNTQRRIARGLDKFVLKNPRPFIMEMNFQNAAQDPEKPMTTQTTANHHYLITPEIVSISQTGSKNRASSIKEPLRTVCVKNEHCLTTPILTKFQQNSLGQPPEKPIDTVMAGATRFGAVMPYITKYFSGEKQAGADINEPAPTVTGIDHSAVVESHLCVLRKNTDCKAMDEPLPTLTTSAGHFAQITTYIQKYDGTQNLKNWDKVRRLLNDYAGYSIAKDEILILEINGVQHFIADIGMRMLKAKELKLAQGFPVDYVIDIEPYIGKKYSEAKQIARLGNAVCPQVATALIRANMTDMAYKKPLHTVKELNAAMCG